MKNNDRKPDELAQGDMINSMELAMMEGRLDRRSFLRLAAVLGLSGTAAASMAKKATDVHANQAALSRSLKPKYDYIVCGAGSSGCVVASRLTENPDIHVLLIEAGGTDQIDNVQNPALWPSNLGSERDWGHKSLPQSALNDRVLALSMGKVLGGGSSINVMAYARGHKNDYDYWAAEAGAPEWNYQHVLEIYKRIENWQGKPDPAYRGSGGNVWVEPAKSPNPIAPAMVKAAASVGIPSFDDHNGKMMEGPGGCAIANTTIKDGRRRSMAAQYLYPAMDRPNLTVLTKAQVNKIALKGSVATGVEFSWKGKLHKIGAVKEVILSCGAINTPKLLMLSGIGEDSSLKRAGIKAVHHLPGVGKNFMDHILLGGCIWEYNTPEPPRNNLAECTFFCKSDSSLDTPDLQPFQIEVPYTSEKTSASFNIPQAAWSIAPGLVRPASRGYIELRSSNPQDPMNVHANLLSEPADMRALVRAVELCREIGNAPEMREYAKREVMPGPLKGRDLENFIRDAALTYWHQTGTCKMGRDEMAVVDGSLRVRGIDNLRVADGSIMPRVTTGNTMAGCMIIGERMAEILKGSKVKSA